ncbi:uncharacterized protein LOC112568776 [Pomacea canaliculata]|uniref:uncharacterized protein LOC112568776 n=1 Tax=Pomacea canaliculata TaxID=400727 RepID=UPI000D72DB42|nr:uncharacterized protein LOC112568776 [Pomacea canaliculata]
MLTSCTHSFGNINMLMMGISLFWFSLAPAEGVNIQPCNDDGFVEVLAGQKTLITCRAEGRVVWRLTVGLHNFSQYFPLAECTEHVCNSSGYFTEIFQAKVLDPHNKTITINAENTSISSNILLVNSILECVHNAGTYNAESSTCAINYVFPSENVSCNAVTTSWNVHVSCVIGSVFSSSKMYKCHLYRLKSEMESLQSVTMVTSPTRESVTTGEVKASGSCQFILTLSEEANFFVAVSPGDRNYSVKFPAHDKKIDETKAWKVS